MKYNDPEYKDVRLLSFPMDLGIDPTNLLFEKFL